MWSFCFVLLVVRCQTETELCARGAKRSERQVNGCVHAHCSLASWAMQVNRSDIFSSSCELNCPRKIRIGWGWFSSLRLTWTKPDRGRVSVGRLRSVCYGKEERNKKERLGRPSANNNDDTTNLAPARETRTNKPDWTEKELKRNCRRATEQSRL